MSYARPTKRELIESNKLAIESLDNRIRDAMALFDETRQMVFALSDQLNAALFNQTLADDLAETPKSEAQLRIEARQKEKEDEADERARRPKLAAADLFNLLVNLGNATEMEFPTDEDLEQIDRLIDELQEEHRREYEDALRRCEG